VARRGLVPGHGRSSPGSERSRPCLHAEGWTAWLPAPGTRCGFGTPAAPMSSGTRRWSPSCVPVGDKRHSAADATSSSGRRATSAAARSAAARPRRGGCRRPAGARRARRAGRSTSLARVCSRRRACPSRAGVATSARVSISDSVIGLRHTSLQVHAYAESRLRTVSSSGECGTTISIVPPTSSARTRSCTAVPARASRAACSAARRRSSGL
jgi:hypothetical protein